MDWAKTIQGKEVHATEAVDGIYYTCPVCSERVQFIVHKKGTHFFKHWIGSKREDCENYKAGFLYNPESSEIQDWLSNQSQLGQLPQGLLESDQVEEFLSWLDYVFEGYRLEDFAWAMSKEIFQEICIGAQKEKPELNAFKGTFSSEEAYDLLWRMARFLGLIEYYRLEGRAIPIHWEDHFNELYNYFQSSNESEQRKPRGVEQDKLLVELKDNHIHFATEGMAGVQSKSTEEVLREGSTLNIDPQVKARLSRKGLLVCQLIEDSFYGCRQTEIGDEVLLITTLENREGNEEAIRSLSNETVEPIPIDGLPEGWLCYTFEVEGIYTENKPEWFKNLPLHLEGGLKLEHLKYMAIAPPDLIVSPEACSTIEELTLLRGDQNVEIKAIFLETGQCVISNKYLVEPGEYCFYSKQSPQVLKFWVVEPSPELRFPWPDECNGGWSFTKDEWPSLIQARNEDVSTRPCFLGPIQYGSFIRLQERNAKQGWYEIIRAKRIQSKGRLKNPRLQQVINKKLKKYEGS